MKLGPIPITLDPGMDAEEWMLVSPLEDGSVFVVANDVAADRRLELTPGGFHYSGRAVAMSPGMFDPKANMKAAADYVRKRFGLGVTHGEWPPSLSRSSEHYTHFAGLTDDYVRRHIARARLTRALTTFGRDLAAAAYATEEHTMPTTSGPTVTPYDPERLRARVGDVQVAGAARPPGHFERARGFGAEDVDSLARERWLEGYDAGHAEGAEREEARFPDVYRDGWQAGNAQVPRAIAQRLGERAHLVQQLAQAAGKTRLPVAQYRQACDAIGALMGQLIGEFEYPHLRELPLATRHVQPLPIDDDARDGMSPEQIRAFENFAQLLANAQHYIVPERVGDAADGVPVNTTTRRT